MRLKFQKQGIMKFVSRIEPEARLKAEDIIRLPVRKILIPWDRI